jgi:hypothetical protein
LNAPATPPTPCCSRGESSGSNGPGRPPAGTSAGVSGKEPSGEDEARHSGHRHADGRARPPWMRPPGWLYLPHLGIGSGADICSAGEAQSHDAPLTELGGMLDDAGADDEEHRAEAVPIRGRDQAPGSRRQRIDIATGPIRGRTCAPGGARRGGGGSAALARHFACLDQERAAKRARCGDIDDQGSKPSAAQRMNALRQRLADRIAGGTRATGAATTLDVGQSDADSSHPRRRWDTSRPVDRAGAEPAAAGAPPWGMSDMQGPSNEDANIHLTMDARAGGGGASAAGGLPSPASAAAAAQYAWHAADATTPAP